MALTDNLVSYWKLDESSGNAADSAGSNTLTNTSVTYAAGKINNGAVYDGTTTPILQITDASQTGLDITGNLSLSFWLNLTTFSSGKAFSVVDKFGSGTQRSYLFRLYNNAGTHQFLSNISANGSTSTQTTTDTGTLSTGTWYHFVVVYTASAGTIDLYINNTAQTQQSGHNTSIFNGTEPFRLGQGNNGSPDGKIDEVGIWSKTLTSGEVSSLYNAGAGLQYPFSSAHNLSLLGVGT